MGIGPGSALDRTHRAEQAIAKSSVIVGYNTYLRLIQDITAGKEILSSGMRQEPERCRAALLRAQQGEIVALISSGDPGIYGMAGLALELAHAEGFSVPIEIIPGVPASTAAAARLGAPLMLDFACISLSDLLLPWETILQRLEAVAAADMAVALYNPRSKTRIKHLAEAADIFRKYRPQTTPVGIASRVGAGDEQIVISDLGHFLEEEIAMRSLVVIGDKSTRCIGNWLVTPRGYRL